VTGATAVAGAVPDVKNWLILAESHLTWRLFGSMVRGIDALAVAIG
jgi:hypothetical protein